MNYPENRGHNHGQGAEEKLYILEKELARASIYILENIREYESALDSLLFSKKFANDVFRPSARAL